MRILLYFAFCTIFLSCSTHKEKKIKNYGEFFNIILNKRHVKGTILIYNSENKTYNSNSFYKANTGYLPAGTFAIPHTLITLESGVMQDDKHTTKQTSTRKSSCNARAYYTIDQAFKKTFDPYYQEATRRLGLSKMNYYLNKFNYPKMMITEYTLDNFWFYGPSKITPFEQIDFLENFYEKKIPIRKSTYFKLLNMMLIKETEDYKIYAKESWTDYNNNGWCVGFIVKNNKTYYFATNIEPKNSQSFRNNYISSQEITLEALNIMNIL